MVRHIIPIDIVPAVGLAIDSIAAPITAPIKMIFRMFLALIPVLPAN